METVLFHQLVPPLGHFWSDAIFHYLRCVPVAAEIQHKGDRLITMGKSWLSAGVPYNVPPAEGSGEVHPQAGEHIVQIAGRRHIQTERFQLGGQSQTVSMGAVPA